MHKVHLLCVLVDWALNSADFSFSTIILLDWEKREYIQVPHAGPDDNDLRM
jgi:hypothetical protein